MNQIWKRMEQIGIIPVVVLEDSKDAEPLAEALLEGGLPCAEVTFRTDAAEDAIRRMSEHFPELLVGAGTVLKTGQVDRATEAGAQFIVSPGLNPKVVGYCVERGIPCVPGTATPSEIEQALEYGLDVVKFFPAEALGGLKLMKAMAAPYGNVRFLPTGGINPQNVREYLAYERIIACGGSWMVSGELIREGNYTRIRELVREAVAIVREMRGEKQ